MEPNLIFVYMKHTSIMLHSKCTSTKRTGNNCKFNFFLTENKKLISKMIFHTKKKEEEKPKTMCKPRIRPKF